MSKQLNALVHPQKTHKHAMHQPINSPCTVLQNNHARAQALAYVSVVCFVLNRLLRLAAEPLALHFFSPSSHVYCSAKATRLAPPSSLYHMLPRLLLSHHGRRFGGPSFVRCCLPWSPCSWLRCIRPRVSACLGGSQQLHTGSALRGSAGSAPDVWRLCKPHQVCVRTVIPVILCLSTPELWTTS